MRETLKKRLFEDLKTWNSDLERMAENQVSGFEIGKMEEKCSREDKNGTRGTPEKRWLEDLKTWDSGLERIAENSSECFRAGKDRGKMFKRR